MAGFPGPGIYRISLSDHPYLYAIREQNHHALGHLALGEYTQQDWVFQRVGPEALQKYMIKQRGENLAAAALFPPEDGEDYEGEEGEGANNPPEGFANVFIYSAPLDLIAHWTIEMLDNRFLLRNVPHNNSYMLPGADPNVAPPGTQINVLCPFIQGDAADPPAGNRWNILPWVPGPGLQRITLGIDPDFDLVETDAGVFIRPAGPHQNWRIIPADIEEGVQTYFIKRKETARVIGLDPTLGVAEVVWALVTCQAQAGVDTRTQRWKIRIVQNLFVLQSVARPDLYMAAQHHPLDDLNILEFNVGVKTIPAANPPPRECAWDILPWIPRFGSHRISLRNNPGLDLTPTGDNGVVALEGPAQTWTITPASDNVQRTQKYLIRPIGSNTVLAALDPAAGGVAGVQLVEVAQHLQRSYDERPYHWRIVSFEDTFLIRNAAFPACYMAKRNGAVENNVEARPIPNDNRENPPLAFRWDIEILPQD